MPTVTIDAHFSDYDDGTSFSWPAASVACSAGDIILANLGSQLSYTSTDGATTITFGQFWTGSVWSGTGVPYVNVAATVNLEDDNFADIEVLAAVDYYVDAHTNEYPVHQKSGHHAIHGGHVRNKAIGRKHAHPHHPGKHHITEAVFTVQQLGGTYNAVSLGASEAAITWTGGTFSNDGGGSLVSFSASGTAAAPASVSGPTTWVPLRCLEGDYIVLNNSGASITTLNYNSVGITIPNGAIAAVDSVDTTNDAYIGIYIIGRVSITTDPQTGLPWVHGWHTHAHQKHGGHIAGNAVAELHIGAGQVHGGEAGHKDHHAAGSHARRHHQKATPHRVHTSGVIFWVTATNTGAGNCTVNWTGGTLYNDDNTSYAVTAGALASVPTGAYIGYNPTGAVINASYGSAQSFPANGLGWVTSANDFSQASQDPIIVLGRVSSAVDNKTNQYTISHHLPGAHQVHGQQIADNAIYEGHILAGNVHGGEGGHANHVAGQAIDGSTAHDHIAHQSLHGGEGGNADHHATQSHHVKHARREHPVGHHPHGSTITVTNTNNVAGTCTVTTPSGLTIWGLDGVSWAVPSSALNNVPNQSYIVFNPSAASITSTTGGLICGVNAVVYFPSGNDFRQASQDGLVILGHVGNTIDPNTGQYLMHAHHMSMHQVHGLHVASNAITGGTHIKKDQSIIGGSAGHIASRTISGGREIALDGLIGSSHIGSSQINQAHLNGQVVGLGNLKNPGSGGVAVTSGQDNWTASFSGSWVMRNWANLSPPASGSLTGGNMSSMTVGGSQFQVEVQLKNTNGVWGAYHRVYRMFLQSSPSSVPNEAQILSDDGNWEIFVQRFDILTDGSVACVVGTFGSGTPGIGLQFRIIWAVQS